MHTRRGLRVGLGIVTALAGALLAPAAAHATPPAPTAIAFAIEHADCDGAGVNSFALYLNDTLLATLPSTEDCACNASPLVATFTDAATLALYDPAACNRFRVDVSGDGHDVALGFVRVTVSGAGAAASTCLFDGRPDNASPNCAARDLCDGNGLSFDVASVGTLVACAVDQCHDATCDPATRQCSSSAKPDGASCNDGNGCTQTDTCQSGVCTGSNPVVCTALDQCHVAGTCDPTTGVCSNPAKTNGTACNDNNACTSGETCQNGSCGSPTGTVTCTALDQCHVAGTCDTTTGVCSNPTKTNGTACNDGNACTRTDTCQSGVARGATRSSARPRISATWRGPATRRTGRARTRRSHSPALPDT